MRRRHFGSSRFGSRRSHFRTMGMMRRTSFRTMNRMHGYSRYGYPPFGIRRSHFHSGGGIGFPLHGRYGSGSIAIIVGIAVIFIIITILMLVFTLITFPQFF